MEILHKSAQVNQFPLLDIIKYTAVVTSLINLLVFSQSSMRRHPILQYLLAVSLSDAVYTLSMAVILVLAKSCEYERANRKINNSQHFTDARVCFYYSLFVNLLSEYLTSCLALFSILVEILVTFQRMRLISTDTSNLSNEPEKHRSYSICAVLLGCSLAVYSPVLCMNEVRTIETSGWNNETVMRRDYASGKTEFGKTATGLFIVKALTLTRMSLVIVVLTVANVITSIKFTSFYKRKSALKQIIRGF
jgi:hypothetical protein